MVRAGMPRRIPDAASLQKITVKPEQEILALKGTRQIEVTAHYSDGTQRNVTRYAQFQSNEAGIAAVSEDGLVRAQGICGEAAIMARYMGQIAAGGEKVTPTWDTD